MYTQITLHIVAKENYDKAMDLLKVNTQLAKKAKGFVSREVFFDINDSLKGYSITSWKTKKDLEVFRDSPERPPLSIEGTDRSVYLLTKKAKVLLFTRTDSAVFKIVDKS